MKRARLASAHLLLPLLLLLFLGLAIPAGPAWAEDDAGAQAAARIAQEEHGGRVLKVERKGEGYRVKLLKDSGKVRVVTVPAKKVEVGKGSEKKKGKGGEDRRDRDRESRGRRE